jgi:hypothetical protein
MPKFDHVYVLAFTVISDTPDASDVTPDMFKAALQSRARDLELTNEWEEAVGDPYDTCELG